MPPLFRLVVALASPCLLLLGSCTTTGSGHLPSDGGLFGGDLGIPGDLAAGDLALPTRADLAVAPGCGNLRKDGDETDVDCGGARCPGCASGKACLRATDCQSGLCLNNVCQERSCTDSIQNGAE